MKVWIDEDEWYPVLSVRKDGKAIATISGTPSDRRSLLNGLARLRRAGFRWPPG